MGHAAQCGVVQAEVAGSVVHPDWALVIGGASCVWDDVRTWEEWYGQQWDGIVVAANDIGCHWPRPLHHWASLHSKKFARWRSLREHLCPGEVMPVTWNQGSRSRRHPATDQALMPWPGGSSGMLAVQVAQAVGCTKAILCGVPMTATAHFAESTEVFLPQWSEAARHWRAWEKYEQRMRGWVKSMSGNTRALFGAPTLAWLLTK